MLDKWHKREDNEAIRKCPECGRTDLFRDHKVGELVCENCGTVATSKIFNRGPEWRAFNIEQREKRTRVGAPTTFTIHDKGLSTIIDWRGKDVYGRRLKPEQRAQAYRLRKWNRRSKVSGSSQRNLAYALSELTKDAYKLNLPRNVLETASMIYRQVVRKRIVRGRSIQGIAAASIYMACRQCKVVRTLDEVGTVAGISRKECARNYRSLLRKLETKVPPVEVKSYVSKLVNHLHLSGDVENLAMKIIKLATDLMLMSGRGPSGIASAVLYISCILCGERRTQQQIAEEAQVTEVTIRNRYQELIKKISFEMDL
jgi:transcription initiation factor TFIIB